MMLSFEQTPEFKEDLKALSKRWRSLESDIASAEAALRVIYSGEEEIYRQFFALNRATVITKTETAEAVKMRLDCKSIGNDKKTRLVFVAVKTEGTIKFVELYAKNEKPREDPGRIKKYLS